MRFSGSIAVVVTALFSYFAEFSVSSYAADTQTQQDQQVNQNNAPKNSESVGNLYIQEYRVEGTHQLPRLEVEEAVYPFLGPGRTTDDVEKVRLFIGQGLVQLAGALVLIVGTLIIIFSTNVRL